MSIRKKIELLIREIKPDDHNGRYLRENLRRIKEHLDGIAEGSISVGAAVTAEDADNAAFAEATSYELHEVTADGQTAFVLDYTPADTSKVRMIINSCEVINGTHFTVVGKNVTYSPLAADFDLELVNELGLPDLVLFQYIKA